MAMIDLPEVSCNFAQSLYDLVLKEADGCGEAVTPYTIELKDFIGYLAGALACDAEESFIFDKECR